MTWGHSDGIGLRTCPGCVWEETTLQTVQQRHTQWPISITGLSFNLQFPFLIFEFLVQFNNDSFTPAAKFMNSGDNLCNSSLHGTGRAMQWIGITSIAGGNVCQSEPVSTLQTKRWPLKLRSPLVYSSPTNTIKSPVRKQVSAMNRQKTIQVQFFNKDNYKRWKNQLRKANCCFLIDPVFDIITHQFKYNHIKHGGKKRNFAS